MAGFKHRKPLKEMSPEELEAYIQLQKELIANIKRSYLSEHEQSNRVSPYVHCAVMAAKFLYGENTEEFKMFKLKLYHQGPSYKPAHQSFKSQENAYELQGFKRISEHRKFASQQQEQNVKS